MDVMFEMPSGLNTEIVITAEFASEKIDKLNAIRLQAG